MMRIYLDMIGCRLNQSEIEVMARQFSAAGHDLVGDPENADLAVVNTCTVTRAAAADSRKTIRRIARGGVRKIISTGCWSTLHPDQASQLPGVVQVIPNVRKASLVADLLCLDGEVIERKPLQRIMIPGKRLRTRAFIKAQDGCNHHCAFCITTFARGTSRSIPQVKVILEVNAAVQGGVREAVLTGVQLGSWGNDLDPPQDLNGLIQGVLKSTDIDRLRLSSIEPWDITPGLIDSLRQDRVARHLHLPLQSGSVTVLRRMARAITPERYAELLDQIRMQIPDIAITTDILAGFPGETEDEFQESLDFIRQMKFSDGHVFIYSPRKGTLAAEYPNQVPHELRKERSVRIRAVLEDSRIDYAKGFIGREECVLWEGVKPSDNGSCRAVGLTGNYLRVAADASPELWNRFSRIKILSVSHDVIEAEILDTV
jgi:threonylcarbamoyladenosine tRNA methylthiotransferase MtaB